MPVAASRSITARVPIRWSMPTVATPGRWCSSEQISTMGVAPRICSTTGMKTCVGAITATASTSWLRKCANASCTRSGRYSDSVVTDR